MSELKVGDLVFYKDYFCMITAITPSITPVSYINPSVFDSKFDKLSLIRKFRDNGSPINKTVWSDWLYRCWITHPDELFKTIINRNQELLKVYKSII